jgi:hypothetical protein
VPSPARSAFAARAATGDALELGGVVWIPIIERAACSASRRCAIQLAFGFEPVFLVAPLLASARLVALIRALRNPVGIRARSDVDGFGAVVSAW